MRASACPVRILNLGCYNVRVILIHVFGSLNLDLSGFICLKDLCFISQLNFTLLLIIARVSEHRRPIGFKLRGFIVHFSLFRVQHVKYLFSDPYLLPFLYIFFHSLELLPCLNALI